MKPTAPVPHAATVAYRLRRKDTTTASNVQGAGCLMSILGLFVLPLLVPIGIAILIVGLCISSTVTWICSHCGNLVQSQSQVCPTCRIQLVKAPFRLGCMGWAALILFCIVGLAGLAYKINPHPIDNWLEDNRARFNQTGKYRQ